MELSVRREGERKAVLQCAADTFRAATGSGGIGPKKAEGDGVTPIGVFPIRRVLYRGDRIARPLTGMPVEVIFADDGWCDAPGDAAYNRQVKLPYRSRAEALWREDH